VAQARLQVPERRDRLAVDQLQAMVGCRTILCFTLGFQTAPTEGFADIDQAIKRGMTVFTAAPLQPVGAPFP